MKMVDVQCLECGKIFTISSRYSHQIKFCSNECRNARNRREKVHLKSVYTETCLHCGNKFELRTSLRGKQVYCSLQCAGKAGGKERIGENDPRWKPKIIINCDYCGKSFETYPSRAGRRRYCCKAHQLLGNVKRFVGNKRTGIEIAMAKALTNNEIPFQEQVVMFDKFQVDFLLSNNIIVQCDGIYWHDRPEAKRRDKGQDAYFKKCGYSILRFTDKEINASIDKCIEKIKNIIQISH